MVQRRTKLQARLGLIAAGFVLARLVDVGLRRRATQFVARGRAELVRRGVVTGPGTAAWRYAGPWAYHRGMNSRRSAATFAALLGIACLVPLTACGKAQGQPSAVALDCGTFYWTADDACWFSRQPVGAGITAAPFRASATLKSAIVDSVKINGQPVSPLDPAHVVQTHGSRLTFVLPSSPPLAESASFDVVIAYRGWLLGDTTETAETARRFQYTRLLPGACQAQKPTVSVTSGAVDVSVTASGLATNCKQAALVLKSGSGSVGGGVGANRPSHPQSTHYKDALADAYATNSGGANLTVTTTTRLTASKQYFELVAWGFDGGFSYAYSDSFIGTPPTTPTPTHSAIVSQYEFCAKSSLGNIQLYWSAASQSAAMAEIAAQYGGYTITPGACPDEPSSGKGSLEKCMSEFARALDVARETTCDEDRYRIVSKSVRSGRSPVVGGRLVVRYRPSRLIVGWPSGVSRAGVPVTSEPPAPLRRPVS